MEANMREEPSGWELLESKKYKAAVERFHQEFEETGADACFINAAIAYLCIGDPKKALEELDRASAVQGSERVAGAPEPSSTVCNIKGTAQWILGRFADVVRAWTAGLDSQYTDASGGMEVALLLYYASVRQPKVYSPNESEKVLNRTARHEWSSEWPGPVGKFLLGKLSEEKVRRLGVFEVETVTVEQLAQFEFYLGCKELAYGNLEAFLSHLKKTADATGCEFLCEYHLARHELKEQRR
jgi:hypothetical protein